MENPRELAISILIKTQAGSYSNLTLNHYMNRAIPRKDRALVTELVNGVIKNKTKLDYIISQFSKIRLVKLSPFVINAIRLSLYQVFFLDRVPDFAAVNESVNLVKKFEGVKAANFVNAILRNALRNKDKITYPNKEKDVKKYLTVNFSFPVWMVTRWIKLFGLEFTTSLCKAFNERPKQCIRINTLLTDEKTLRRRLSIEGVDTVPGFFASEALYINGMHPVNTLKSFHEGLCTLQDESSILASLAVGVDINDRILDVAAAPGGKATHMAALMKNSGEITAWDIHPHRVKLLESNARRLGITNIFTQVRDARIPIEILFNKFDKVLIDAPCSGIGVIRRKPDIKWSKKPEDLQALKIQQKKIFEVCSKYVKSGGFLVYCTCSIDPEENQGIVDEFLSTHENFMYDDLRPYLPEGLWKNIKKPYGNITLYPNVHGTNGFFIARLKKA